ncbi:hypothetical protein CVT26_007266 [Gymnopilus dilepis]|uniref:Uncharacterized protein n=1 Tax=Gymnopilus dilepis TaxID=231916 RepID=A0A409VM51_9AGAR|nr:hypothetical protein CVT26_007266 [Gymnopilus dilepis]
MTIQQYEKQTLMGNALLNLDLQPIVNGAGVNLAAPQPPPRLSTTTYFPFLSFAVEAFGWPFASLDALQVV